MTNSKQQILEELAAANKELWHLRRDKGVLQRENEKLIRQRDGVMAHRLTMMNALHSSDIMYHHHGEHFFLNFDSIYDIGPIK